MKEVNQKIDLEERTARFGEGIIDFCKTVEKNIISESIISQVIRSGTSVGANYMEANAASSKRDFQNKIYISKKEVQETKHWLRMLVRVYPLRQEDLISLWNEAEELTLIFGKIISTLRRKSSIQNS